MRLHGPARRDRHAGRALYLRVRADGQGGDRLRRRHGPQRRVCVPLPELSRRHPGRELQDAFAESGTTQTLPGITLWFVNFCNGLIKVWYIPVIIIAAVVGVLVLYINTPKGKYNFHYFKYKMPVFGKLIYAMDFSRLMRAMLLNLENGMRIQEALEVSKAVIKNYVMLSIIETSINNILIGASWIEPFENSGLASSMQTEMLKIGMQTDIVEMMRKLVEYMEIDIENLMQKVMAVLPQIVYSIVGVFLIFLVVVIIVPCIQLYMGAWILDSVDLPI